MNTHQHADLLDQYWADLAASAAAAPPDGLDPQLAGVSRSLLTTLPAPDPDPAFAADLRARLASAAARPRPARPALLRSRLVLRLATVAAIIVAAIGGALLLRPDSASADAILARAQVVADAPPIQDFATFTMSEVRFGPDRSVGAEQRWTFAAPDRLRWERITVTLGLDGQATRRLAAAHVADGATIWRYDAATNVAEQERDLPPGSRPPGAQLPAAGISLPGTSILDINGALSRQNPCYANTLIGEEPVIGRPAYLIEGRYLCEQSPAYAAEGGRWRLWVDKETYFVLKSEEYSLKDNALRSTTEVTEFQIDAPVDPAAFVFTPPEGASVRDLRQPAPPAVDELEQALSARAADYAGPLLIPRTIPRDLAPRAPRFEDGEVMLEFVAPAEADTQASAELFGVWMAQHKTSPEDLSLLGQTPRGRTEVIAIGEGVALYFPGVRRPTGLVASQRLVLARDGVVVTLLSEALTRDELVGMAASLEPVAGSAPPDSAAPRPAIPPKDEATVPTLSPEEELAAAAAVHRYYGTTETPDRDTVQVERQSGDYLLAYSASADPSTSPNPLFLKRTDGQWQVVSAGFEAYIDPAIFDQLGIPEALR